MPKQRKAFNSIRLTSKIERNTTLRRPGHAVFLSRHAVPRYSVLAETSVSKHTSHGVMHDIFTRHAKSRLRHTYIFFTHRFSFCFNFTDAEVFMHTIAQQFLPINDGEKESKWHRCPLVHFIISDGTIEDATSVSPHIFWRDARNKITNTCE